MSATCCLHLWPRRRHKPSTHLASSTPSLSSALRIPQVASGFQKASLSPFLAPRAAQASCSQVWLSREAGLHLQSRPGLRRGPVCLVCAGLAGRSSLTHPPGGSCVAASSQDCDPASFQGAREGFQVAGPPLPSRPRARGRGGADFPHLFARRPVLPRSVPCPFYYAFSFYQVYKVKYCVFIT